MRSLSKMRGGGGGSYATVEEFYDGMKTDATSKPPNTKEGYRYLRQQLREFGVDKLKKFYEDSNHIKNGKLATEGPFNIWARVGSGVMTQKDMIEANQEFGEILKNLNIKEKEYVLCSNRPDNDANWNSKDKNWDDKASMSRQHRFLAIKNMDWTLFNAITFGIENETKLKEAIKYVTDAHRAAQEWVTRENSDWSDKVGFYFHVYPHNSVPSFHMHILDLGDETEEYVGRAYHHMNWKNTPVQDVLDVLNEELQSLQDEKEEAQKAYYRERGPDLGGSRRKENQKNQKNQKEVDEAKNK